MISIPALAPYTSLFGFMIGLPTLVGAYYQSWKARQESREARQGLLYSQNCLEYTLADGTTINLVPLETLHSLPKPGDIVLLPGTGPAPHYLNHGAYRVNRVEHIYARVDRTQVTLGHARLVKAVAYVDTLAADGYVDLDERAPVAFVPQESATA
jgi:hypothetical protein